MTGPDPGDGDGDWDSNSPPDANLGLKTWYFHLEQETWARVLGREGSGPGVPSAGLTRWHQSRGRQSRVGGDLRRCLGWGQQGGEGRSSWHLLRTSRVPGIASWKPQDNAQEMDNRVILISWMKKLFREVKQPAQSHPASSGRS